MFVFEGLSNGAMSKIEKLVPFDQPNSEKFMIFKNKSILFQERKYLSFSTRIRMIKLRDPLCEIVEDPNIYIRSKLSE